MVYLDYAANAPMRPQALEAYVLAAQASANSASLHTPGQQAARRVEAARKRVAAFVGRLPSEVVFTSGGTEANAMAILGACRAQERRQLVVSAIEHKSVLAAAEALAREGFTLTKVPVGGDGVVDVAALAAAIGPETALVSVMAVNNETGARQPLAAIAEAVHAAGALLHVDAVQAGYEDLSGIPADLLSLSAHKLGGPLGVGALVVRKGVKLLPLVYGGGHERGVRAGTLNVPGIVAFGVAAEEAAASRQAEVARLGALREQLRSRLLAGVPGARVIGRPDASSPQILALAFAGLDGESLVTQLDLAGVAAGSGAACSALAGDPSHVLVELGLSMAEVNGSLRLSLGWATTESDIDEAAATVVRVVNAMLTTRPMAL